MNGFEENSTSFWSAVISSPTFDTGWAHSGTYSLLISAGNAGGARFDLGSAKTSGTLWGRAYFRFNALPTSAVQFVLMESDVGADGLELRWLEPNDVIQLRNVISGTVVNGTITPVLGTVYRFEWRVAISDVSGAMEFKMFDGDSTTPLETLNINGEDSLPGNYRRATVGKFNFNTGSVSVDDFALNDEAGSTDNGYPGPGKIALAVPASNVSVTWEGTGGTTNFDRIDDVPGTPDDATTFNEEAATLNSVDQFGLSALPAEVPSDATMGSMMLIGRVGSDSSANARNIRFKIWNEVGALTDGPNFNINTATWRSVAHDLEALIVSLAGKSKANVQSYNIGYENVVDDQTRPRRVTDLHVNVEWIETAAVPGSPLLSARQIFVLP